MHRNCFSGLLVPAAAALFISLTATSTGLAQTVSLTGGNISLTFAIPVAGSDLSDVVDNTSCSLSWTRPGGSGSSSSKITVQTNISPTTAVAALEVKAINVSGGTSVGKVALTLAAKPMVTGIRTASGGCDLEYTASASLGDGPGTDVHTVTFTITD